MPINLVDDGSFSIWGIVMSTSYVFSSYESHQAISAAERSSWGASGGGNFGFRSGNRNRGRLGEVEGDEAEWDWAWIRILMDLADEMELFWLRGFGDPAKATLNCPSAGMVAESEVGVYNPVFKFKGGTLSSGEQNNVNGVSPVSADLVWDVRVGRGCF